MALSQAEAGSAYLGSRDQIDPLQAQMAENTRALEAAVLHRLAEYQGLTDEEFAQIHPEMIADLDQLQ